MRKYAMTVITTPSEQFSQLVSRSTTEANLFRDFLRLCWYYLIALRISFMDRVVLIVDSLYFEDYGTCSIGTAGDHGVFLFHPALHDGTAL